MFNKGNIFMIEGLDRCCNIAPIAPIACFFTYSIHPREPVKSTADRLLSHAQP